MHNIRHHWTHYVGLISSGLCLVHCLLLPFLIPLMPALSPFADHNVWVEGLFIALIALTTITIVNGYRQHRSPNTLIFASIGFVFLMMSLFVHGTLVQVAISGIGGVFMLRAHYTNYRLCHAKRCCDSAH